MSDGRVPPAIGCIRCATACRRVGLGSSVGSATSRGDHSVDACKHHGPEHHGGSTHHDRLCPSLRVACPCAVLRRCYRRRPRAGRPGRCAGRRAALPQAVEREESRIAAHPRAETAIHDQARLPINRRSELRDQGRAPRERPRVCDERRGRVRPHLDPSPAGPIRPHHERRPSRPVTGDRIASRSRSVGRAKP
jgi:hypothetical protein